MDPIKNSVGAALYAVVRQYVLSRSDTPGINPRPGENRELENAKPIQKKPLEVTFNIFKERVRYSVDRVSGELMIVLDSRDVFDLKDRVDTLKHGALFDKVG